MKHPRYEDYPPDITALSERVLLTAWPALAAYHHKDGTRPQEPAGISRWPIRHGGIGLSSMGRFTTTGNCVVNYAGTAASLSPIAIRR